MIDPKVIRKSPLIVKEMLIKRGYGEKEANEMVNDVVKADEKRRSLQVEIDKKRAEINRISDLIAKEKREGRDVSELVEKSKKIGEELKGKEEKMREADREFREKLLLIPNLVHSSVPAGADSSENRVYRIWGEAPEFNFKVLPHYELGEKLKILDFSRGAKLSGSGFTVSISAGALMERALINFMLDLHTKEHNYTEVLPPFLVNKESMIGTGQLPKFEDDMYSVSPDGFYLVPTAEVPLTNLHRNEILDETSLPLKYTAYTPCFRREAGAYGAQTRGIIRQHQFNKVELVKFTTPESSYDELETLLEDAEEILKRLNLHYRVVVLCTGDLGFSASKTYDIEVYLPSKGDYTEISSVSNFEDFQARRAMIRCKKKGGKPRFVHTLNGSGLAVGRTVVAILENYQQKNGAVKIPEVLIPYMGGIERIEP